VAGHHYENLPAHCFWSRGVSPIPASEFDPVVSVPFKLPASTRLATAGSCFAQRLGQYLADHGFPPYVTEDAHPMASAELAHQYQYGVFTARYGNVYTTRQLVQLYQRAHGTFVPREDYWHTDDGRIVDPFRPQIQPNGFSNMAEYAADRRRHFAAVREAFATLDVLVFTMGLTECWTSAEDGSAYPLCPGVRGGVFDPNRYVLENFEVDEIVADMSEFIRLLRSENPNARVVLTVSPVSAKATALDRHVLVSSTYSKCALRASCESLVRRHDGVAYFPSYEIVTGPQARGRYFSEDSRLVTEEGVARVMQLFTKHFLGAASEVSAAPAPATASAERHQSHMAAMKEAVDALCDEEALDPGA